MKIYHYTDLNGLQGIIESCSLRATHFSFLNDSNELIHVMNCLENALKYLRDDFNPETLKFIEQALTHWKSYGITCPYQSGHEGPFPRTALAVSALERTY